jgi:membrane protease YdiL (CAAX protease family)
MALDTSGLDFKKFHLAWFGLVFSTFIIFAIGGIVQGDPAPPVLNLKIITDFSLFAIILYVIGSAIAVLILKGYLKQKNLNLFNLGLSKNFPPSSFLFSLAGVVVGVLIYSAIESVLESLNINMYWRVQREAHLILRTPTDYLLTILFAVIVGPVCEEIIFRGYILATFVEKGYGKLSAIVWSGLIFSSVHIYHGPGVLLFIFLWSFIPAILYLRYGNLYPGIIMHALNNAIAYMLVPVLFS